MAEHYPPKVVTLDDIESFLPWAHIEEIQDIETDECELVIFTGLRHIKDDLSAPLAFIDGMLS